MTEPARPPGLAGFEAALDADPYAWVTRLVYADALEEAGDAPLARAQRWMAAHARAPLAGLGFYLTAENTWDWWRQGGVYENCHDRHTLPPELFNRLGRPAGHFVPENYREYPSRAAAEDALAAALEG